MTIELFVDGRNFGKNHGSAFAAILSGGIKRKYVWEKSLDCENITTNQACLNGLLFALHSVKKSERSGTVKLYFKNQYIHGMLERDDKDWKREPGGANADVIKGVRKTIEGYQDIEILSTSESELMDRVRTFSSDAAKKKKFVDSKN